MNTKNTTTMKSKKFTLKYMPVLDSPSPRYHLLPDGTMVDVYEIGGYQVKVDIVAKKYIATYDEGYEYCDIPTFNDLYRDGILDKERTCIENEYEYYTEKTSLSKEDIDSIIQEFQENGFNITEEAIMHNYSAWCMDMKSGYRDEENNYHLFSPCGCNPLSFRASTLHEKCVDWQHTYMC